MATPEEWIAQTAKLNAEKKYEQVLSLLPDTVLDNTLRAELYTQAAWACIGLNKAEQAVAYAEKAIKLNDKYAEAYRIRGFGKYKLKLYVSAIQDYNMAIELNPVDAAAYNNRGIALDERKEYDQAITDYNKAIELNPNFALAYYNLGITWFNKHAHDKAIENFSKAIELNPNDSRAYYNRGTSWYNREEFDKALADFNVAIELEPAFDPAYFNKAFIYNRQGKYHQALENYNIALALNPDDTEAIYWRDQLLEKINEQKQLQQASSNSIEKLATDLKDCIADILRVAINIEQQPAVHYTKLLVANAVLSGNNSKLRYYNSAYMNDPEEGNTLFDCFSDKSSRNIRLAFNEGKKTNESSVYLGSFLINSAENPQEDELVMWRTYGKDENKIEAAGCSLVIDENFFDKHDETKLLEQAFLEGSMKADGAPLQGLFKVMYYKNGRFLNDDKKQIEQLIKKLETVLAELLNYRNSDEEKKLVDGLIFKYLLRICYLFKSSDYAYEREVRIIQYMPLGTKFIQVDGNTNSAPKLYIESNKPILPYLKKIFVGTNAINQDHWMVYLDYKLREKSRIEQKECKVEVRKSECRFR